MTTEHRTINILLASPNEVLVAGLAKLLDKHHDLTILGSTKDPASTIDAFVELHPDVLVMFCQNIGSSAISVTGTIKASMPTAKVILFSIRRDIAHLAALCKVGLDGYMDQCWSADRIVSAIRAVVMDEVVIEPKLFEFMTRYLPHRFSRSRQIQGSDELTRREVEVLRLVAKGYRNKEIGAELAVSSRTVKAHMHNALSKLGLQNRTEAVVAALQRGIISLKDAP